MVVRVRLRSGRRVSRKTGKNRHVALAFAALLWPAIFIAYGLGFWRLASDLGLSGAFAITDGIFSHWQVWLALAAGLSAAAIALNRYGDNHRTRASGLAPGADQKAGAGATMARRMKSELRSNS
jgi:hypothetical protein